MTTTRVNVRIPKQVCGPLEHFASSQDISMADAIRHALNVKRLNGVVDVIAKIRNRYSARQQRSVSWTGESPVITVRFNAVEITYLDTLVQIKESTRSNVLVDVIMELLTERGYAATIRDLAIENQPRQRCSVMPVIKL